MSKKKKRKGNVSSRKKIRFYVPLFGVILMVIIFFGYHFIAYPTADNFIFFGNSVSSNLIIDLVLVSFIVVSFVVIWFIIEKRIK
ncbi:hypothetical protein LCGC14_1336190 [marine sediment metagenome]|uniref:Uncharacterized protein n=1 Tax=marine sediment metagenome TaxID=412755 RepID=A0A0F9MW01_9ZZZZ